MATMVVEVYDALRSVGVAEDKAVKSAEAMATIEPQFAAVRADLTVMKRQIGALFALVTLPTFWLVFRVAVKVGAAGF